MLLPPGVDQYILCVHVCVVLLIIKIHQKTVYQHIPYNNTQFFKMLISKAKVEKENITDCINMAKMVPYLRFSPTQKIA